MRNDVARPRAEIIDHRTARALVGRLLWSLIQRGFEGNSKCGRWVVYKAGYLYKRRPSNPRW